MNRTVLAAVALAVAACTGLVAGCGSNPTPIVGSGPETAYNPPPIAWSPCTNKLKADGGECGLLTVPLDYAHLDGPKIQIAVSRLRHTSSAGDYQGVVVVNLTSAGGSALAQPAFSKLLPGSITEDYDWIGFDPRGVGDSRPALSCDPGINGYNQPAYLPATPQQQAAGLARMQAYAAACARTGSPLLTHATTADTAQDVDSLRKALGQGQINYYGYWYGAYLGEVYATRYPGRVRRMVLDSSIDPSQVWFGFNIAQNAALEQNLAAFSAWVARYDHLYHLGTDPAAVRRRYDTVLAALTQQPAGGVIGPDVWTDDFLLAYRMENWAELAHAFSAYATHADTGPMKALYDANYPTTGDNAFAMSLATECTDAPWPRDWNTWLDATQKSQAQAPFASWADTWFVAGCQSWSVPAGQPPAVGGPNTPPMLMVLDRSLAPSTTYPGSLAVRRRFPKAVLVQSGGAPEPQTDSSCSPGIAIVGYLSDGTLPDRVPGDTADQKCPANPAPDPTSAAAKDASAGN